MAYSPQKKKMMQLVHIGKNQLGLVRVSNH